MDYKINNRFNLATDSPASHYGIPVVVDNEGNAYGPASIFPIPEKFKPVFGIRKFDQLVWSWATEDGRTKDEFIAAAQFLRQWPEGLQV